VEPEKFIPERYLDENGEINKKVAERVIIFSLGKRSCTGETFGRQELFLLFTSIVREFNILPPEGRKAIRDEVKLVRVLRPRYYELRMVPRY